MIQTCTYLIYSSNITLHVKQASTQSQIFIYERNLLHMQSELTWILVTSYNWSIEIL